MFLNIDNLSYYLLSRGLVEMDDLVHGPLVIQHTGRRNRNYKVFRGDRPGLFVKQVPIVVNETVASILREASFYQIAREHSEYDAMRPNLPKLLDYDGRVHTLSLELLAECEGVTQLHLRLGRFPIELARSLGRIIGVAHLCGARFIASGSEHVRAFSRQVPWLFTVAEHAESVFGSSSGGTRQLVAKLRSDPSMVRALREIADTWRFVSVIHGDIKWDNFVVLRAEALDNPSGIRVVDWELSDVGDPGWDVGALLASYIQHWVLTMSADASQLDNASLIARAPHQLVEFWPSLRAAWLGYARAVGLSGVNAAFELRRHLQFAGARLVLTAFEIAHLSPSIGRTIDLLMMLATNVLIAPEQASSQLFGLGGVLDELSEAEVSS